MAQLAAPQRVADRLTDLVRRLENVAGFAAVVAQLQAGHGATLDGVWGSSCALVAAALVRQAPGTIVIVSPATLDIDAFAEDLALFTTEPSQRFPAWEAAAGERLVVDDVFADRTRVLKRFLADAAPRLIVTSIQSLMQPVPNPDQLRAQTRTLRVGDEVPLDEFLRWLVEQGFDSTSAVELPGEFSARGGILDLFAADWNAPARIEFVGDQIESIRRFEPATQRSLAALDAVEITVLKPTAADRGHLTDYLPPDAWFLLIEPGELEEEGRHYRNRLEQPDDAHAVSDVLREIYRFASVTASSVAAASLELTAHLKIESVERFSGDMQKVRDELDSAGAGQDVFIVCPTDAEIKRLTEIFATTRLATEGKLHFIVGHLHAGFRLVPERTVLLSAGELFQRADLTRPSRRRLGRVIDSFLELREGDLVVHLAHGIGRYRGMTLLEKDDQTEEHLELEFAEKTKIYVPATKIGLVQKYVGGAKSHPTLARIGGRAWVRHKEAAQQAVNDVASDMLDIQASRASRPGISFPLDTEWQQEFAAAFPYQETPDQLAAIEAIRHDMHEPRPLDRLVCGDVGYGKTEVAMRAAFRAVDAGYQVAVLVPTTVLAEQHRRTFTARMAEYPFTIAALSRFCSTQEEKRILADLAVGAVDIVIGTHRLVQHDVRFENLGLVVIDEEQRFGVAVKERLKALRQIVDVLTLTATPIPRTLHMSLLGLRDISNLETPPEDRLAVETRVTRFDDELIRHAALRELNRGGQIFFVHNRVHDIEALSHRLRHIVPEARIGIGHGQMPDHELEDVMVAFVEHKFDMLLSTTIIESGLDIPNANTIFIDDADRYGLADLHQLRGRVGRYKHRAYCYLLIDPARTLTPNAAKRLHAIEEFSDMGAGFAIAMRDLEIRGAGNILGTEQSGHIAAVGYELYCQLLEDAVRRLKHLPPRLSIEVQVDLPGDAFFPRSYVPGMRVKIDLYRRLSRVTTSAELDDLAAELVDRFGPRPAPVERLLTLSQLRIWAHEWRISKIHVEEEYVVFVYTSRPHIEQLARKSGKRLRIVDERSAYLPLGRQIADPNAIWAAAKTLLRPN